MGAVEETEKLKKKFKSANKKPEHNSMCQLHIQKQQHLLRML